jgi:hypothetical protein
MIIVDFSFKLSFVPKGWIYVDYTQASAAAGHNKGDSSELGAILGLWVPLDKS